MMGWRDGHDLVMAAGSGMEIIVTEVLAVMLTLADRSEILLAQS